MGAKWRHPTEAPGKALPGASVRWPFGDAVPFWGKGRLSEMVAFSLALAMLCPFGPGARGGLSEMVAFSLAFAMLGLLGPEGGRSRNGRSFMGFYWLGPFGPGRRLSEMVALSEAFAMLCPFGPGGAYLKWSLFHWLLLCWARSGQGGNCQNCLLFQKLFACWSLFGQGGDYQK